MRRLDQVALSLSLLVLSATGSAAGQDAPANAELGDEIARLVLELASPTRAARLTAQIALLSLPPAARPLLDAVTPPPGFEPRATLDYVRAHLPPAPRGIEVPAGTYPVGSTLNVDANPPREVTLAAFRIDETEVTCFEYYRYLHATHPAVEATTDSTGAAAPDNWTLDRYPYGGERLPVSFITPDQAARYAAWVGGRLPTSDEWEVAAHGTPARPYPWGDKPDRALANTQGHLLPVGSEPQDRSPWGCLDVCGSVMEWVTLPDGRFAARGGHFLSGRHEFLRLTRAPNPVAPGRRRDTGVRVVNRRS